MNEPNLKKRTSSFLLFLPEPDGGSVAISTGERELTEYQKREDERVFKALEESKLDYSYNVAQSTPESNEKDYVIEQLTNKLESMNKLVENRNERIEAQQHMISRLDQQRTEMLKYIGPGMFKVATPIIENEIAKECQKFGHGPAPGNYRSKVDAVRAVRAAFEFLDLPTAKKLVETFPYYDREAKVEYDHHQS